MFLQIRIREIGISVQRAGTNTAWAYTLDLAKKCNIAIEVVFMWKDTQAKGRIVVASVD